MNRRRFPRLSRGNLSNGVTNAGLSCANGNNALSNANWNIAARLSARNKDGTKKK